MDNVNSSQDNVPESVSNEDAIVDEESGTLAVKDRDTLTKEDSDTGAKEKSDTHANDDKDEHVKEDDDDTQAKGNKETIAEKDVDKLTKENTDTHVKEDNDRHAKEDNDTPVKEDNDTPVNEDNGTETKDGNDIQANDDSEDSDKQATRANEDSDTQAQEDRKSKGIHTTMTVVEKRDAVMIRDDVGLTTTKNVGNVNLDDGLQLPMRPMKNTVVLAVSFLTVYSAFQGIQNIQSSINQTAGLGVASLSCIYASLIVTAMISPFYLQFVGLKMSLILAFASHCIYTASNFYPTWWSLIPSSILLGLAVSPMWIARHLYINAMGQYHSQITMVDLHSSVSKYNGIFYCFYEGAQVAGSLISSVVLQQSTLDQSDFNGTRICGADDCPGNVNQTTTIVRPDTKVINILLGIYLACGLLGLGITVIFLRPLKLQEDDRKRLVKKLTTCCTIFKEKKLLMFIPLAVSQALSTSILLTGFTKAFVSCTVGVKMVGYVMMCYGAVTGLSSIVFGHVAKYSGRKPLIIISQIIKIATLLSLLLWKPVPEQVIVLFVIPGVWAIGDGIWKSQFMALVAIAFPNKQSAVFANITTWGTAGFTFILVTDRLLCLRGKFYIAIALWGLGVVGYTLLETTLTREKRRYARLNSIADRVPSKSEAKQF